MIPTSTEIENFVEVFRTRHISRAAIRLGVTQPTLTQSLQKLEEKAGHRLFHRGRQGVVPTDEGHLFYVRALKLIDAWREVGGEIEASRHELRGKFRLGCHASVAAYALPGLFARISQHAPGIELELVHDFSRKITEQVVAYELELGFVVNPFRHPDLVLKKVGEDRVEFWRRKGAGAVPSRLFADPNLKQVQTLLEKTQRTEFKGWSVVPTASLEVARELAAQGQGVAVLPARVARLAAEKLVSYQRGLPTFHDEIYLAYRKEALSSAAGRELARLAGVALAE